MVRCKKITCFVLAFGLGLSSFAQQRLNANHGHSHNDYKQDVPFLTAYNARMGSIEADILLKDGILYVAHDSSEISKSRTLSKMYLDPLFEKFKENGNKVYPEEQNSLQLVIDLKQHYRTVLPSLLKEIDRYKIMFDQSKNPGAARLLLSGEVPPPEKFDEVPEPFMIDGRPEIPYTDQQIKRVGMISQALDTYTRWNGKGNPVAEDEKKLRGVIDAAHSRGKTFRFWASQDSPNTWLVLDKLGVDWINTDVPGRLFEFYKNKDKLNFELPKPYKTYQVTHKRDATEVRPKNIILLIGDGMGLAQIHAALMANHGSLNLSNFTNIGFATTCSADAGNTDSAAGGTAIATGHKTNNRAVGVDPKGNKLTNLADTLAGRGIKSGIISSGDITDATPAAFYAHNAERSMSKAIAADFLKSKASILVGSNQRSFSESANPGLLARLREKGYSVQHSLESFESQKSDRQVVLLPDSATRPVREGRGEMLGRSLRKTIDLLDKNKPGFFIMAEGAQIDYGGHANNLPYVITELHDFDRVVGQALEFADIDGETLVIVTADHETGGLSLLDTDPARGMVMGEFSTNDHTNIVVPVFAYGPGAQLFRGFFENNQIFFKILQALAYQK